MDLEVLYFLLLLRDVARIGRQLKIARTQLAVDLVLKNQVTDFLHRVESDLPQPLGGLQADPAFNTVLIRALAGTHVSAIATRGAPAYPLGFQEHHVITLFTQVQRRRQTGIATTDNADVGLYFPLKSGKSSEHWRRGGIPARGIFAC